MGKKRTPPKTMEPDDKMEGEKQEDNDLKEEIKQGEKIKTKTVDEDKKLDFNLVDVIEQEVKSVEGKTDKDETTKTGPVEPAIKETEETKKKGKKGITGKLGKEKKKREAGTESKDAFKPSPQKEKADGQKITNEFDIDSLIKDDDKLETPNLESGLQAQKEKPREAWKILFSGLDFAGKSSILATIKSEFEKIVNPAPTKLTERGTFTFLGQQIAEWDLGGQRTYRVQYLKRPLMYYQDTSVLFYVIDVLDEERYDEAIDFLYDTLKIFDELKINPLVTVLFNKFDPEIERESKTTRIGIKLTELTNKIKVLAYGRELLIFRTSIFNKFSIIDAFSKSLLQLFPSANVIDYVLAELAVKTSANIIILLDESRLILGSNIVETSDQQYDELVKLSQNTLLSFLYLNENFKFYPFLKSNHIIIQLEKYSFMWVEIKEQEHTFYVIIFKEGANFNDFLAMDMQSVTKTLVKLVRPNE